MKVCCILGLLLAFQGFAQDAEEQNTGPAVEKKRPSWSQGMPERQTAPTTGSLINKPIAEFDREPAKLEMKPEIAAPEFDLEFKPKPADQFVVEPEVLTSKDRAAMRAEFYQSDQAEEPIDETVDAELLAQYKWQVLKVIPVEVPSNFDASKALNLNLQINPDGEVVAVNSTEQEIPLRALKMIEKSIKKWRFEPPVNSGIKSNISRSFNIDIQAD